MSGVAGTLRLCRAVAGATAQHRVVAATPLRSSTRGLASDAVIPGPSSKVEGGGSAREPEPALKVEQDIDEAAARRAALLKRYGNIGDAEPVAVAAKATPGDAEKATEDTNHDEIWGDYVSYMEHQRKKGWKT